MSVNRIIEATTIFELLEELEEFCTESVIRDDDTECMKLKEFVEESENDFLKILSSYFCFCEDGDDIIVAIYEFIENCAGFAKEEQENARQVTKSEFEAVLDECEAKCGLKTCFESEHNVKAAEINAVIDDEDAACSIEYNNINIFLPMIDENANVREYIAGQLGLMLYDVLKTKIPEKRIRHEICRYVPEKVGSPKDARVLFKELFCHVVRYKMQKPRVYTKLDEHLKNVIVVELFRDMIMRYLKE